MNKARAAVEINVVKAIGVRYHRARPPCRQPTPSTARLITPVNMILGTLALTLTTAAATSATARVDAVAITSAKAVRASGELGDDVWQTATPVDAFVQREPHNAGEPSQRTEFRVAYDATTLFVKVRAYDTEPDKIVTYLTRRDLDSPCDWIHILIDSYHDRLTAYEFAVNPS